MDPFQPGITLGFHPRIAPLSEALSFNPLEFEDLPRGNASADGSAPQRIASTLRAAGIDAPSSLYNEAVALARDGHLGQAVSRLQMLLCLDPDDADALLLLARVHAAQGRASDALARVDAAVAAGAICPPGFRDHLEAAIRADRSREEEHRSKVAAREQGEIRGLRAEARQLRTDNIRLEGEAQESLNRERTWKLATVVVALFSTGVVLALMLLPPASPPAEPVAAAPAAPAEVVPVEAPISPLSVQVEASPAVAPPSAPTAAPVAAPVAIAAAPKAAPVAAKAAPAPVKAATVDVKSPRIEPASAKGGKSYTVKSGDTLGKLALRYYGDASKWEKIRDANQDVLKGGINLTVGSKLRIP